VEPTSGIASDMAAPAERDPADERVIHTLIWLCGIPSPTGEEGPICDALIDRLSRARLAGPIRRHGDSIVVPVTRGTGGAPRPKIALVGHTDVVRTSHDGPVRIEGDRLYGPGASDMKSGLALMLDLAEGGRDAAEGVDLTLVFYAREEGPFLDNELGTVLPADEELRGVDLAVCLEPSDNKLSLGASGTIHATVTFTGRTAHSARPWQGENAIHKAGPFLCDLGALAPREVTIDGLLYRTVTSVTMAQGGRGRNVVPDELTLNVNHRFSPDTSIEQAQRDIEALVAGRARIEWRDLSPAAPPHASHPLVAMLREAGIAAVEPKQAWTDVARFATFGVPAVNFGPGDNAQAHQRNEHTSVAKLCEGRRILRRWLLAAAAGAPDGGSRHAGSGDLSGGEDT
jgi:succinyl-diaminopimelate desuccinylase